MKLFKYLDNIVKWTMWLVSPLLIWYALRLFIPFLDIPIYEDQTKESVPIDQNAFYNMVAFGAPFTVKDIHSYGVNAIQGINTYFEKNKPASNHFKRMQEIEDEYVLDSTSISPNNIKTLCYNSEESCLEIVRSNRKVVEDLNQEHEILLARLGGLSKFKYHRNEIAPDYRWLFIPPYQNISTVPRINLTKLAHDYLYGDSSKATNQLLRDLELWRTLTSDTDTLIAKMVFIYIVQNHLRLLAEIIANEPVDSNLLGEIKNSFSSTQPHEYGLCKIMQTETEYFVGMIRQGGMWTDSVYQRLLRRLSFPFMSVSILESAAQRRNQALCELTMLPPRQYLEESEGIYPAISKPNWLNLVIAPQSELFVVSGVSAYEAYPLRMYDYDGYIRLVSAQLELKRQGATQSTIMGLMQQLGLDKLNPYTGESFEWHEETGELSFTGLSNLAEDRRHFRVKIF